MVSAGGSRSGGPSSLREDHSCQGLKVCRLQNSIIYLKNSYLTFKGARGLEEEIPLMVWRACVFDATQTGYRYQISYYTWYCIILINIVYINMLQISRHLHLRGKDVTRSRTRQLKVSKVMSKASQLEPCQQESCGIIGIFSLCQRKPLEPQDQKDWHKTTMRHPQQIHEKTNPDPPIYLMPSPRKNSGLCNRRSECQPFPEFSPA